MFAQLYSFFLQTNPVVQGLVLSVYFSKDTKLRFCNLQLEHATEKTESMACRGNLKQLEMKLQTVQRSEHQCVQDYQREAEALQFLFRINT